MNDEIISCSDLMMKSVGMITSQNTELYNAWKDTVSKIKTFNDSEDFEKRMPIGERLAGNTRVVDLKKGVLLVETDHSGWIQYLRMYKKFIITGLNKRLPDLNINTLAFKIAGSSAKLSDIDSYEKNLKIDQRLMTEEIEKKEKSLDEFFKKVDENKKREETKEYPPELMEKFESLRKTMLTNSEDK